MRVVLCGVVLVAGLRGGAVAGQGGAGAQPGGPPSPEEETALLRRASSLEWQGDLEGAEEVLTGLLLRKPTSSGALFSLERILRSRNRVARVLPWADRFLEAAPTASAPRYMKLRVLVEVDSLAALEPEARRWFAAEPHSPDPYREVARLYERALGPAAALEILDEGRWALKREELLAVEAGDLRLDLGDVEGAVGEWALALRDPEADVAGVVRRVERLDGTPEVAGPVLEALGADGASTERRLAGIGLAVRLGMPGQARAAAERGIEALPRQELPAYLREVARVADAGGAPRLSLWALTALRERGDGAQGDLQAEARLAGAALSAGDTAAAVAAQLRLVRGLPSGTVERRRALGDLIRVESRWSGAPAGTLVTRLDAFLLEYPDAPEADALTATVSGGLMARGAEVDALAVLEGATGPRALQARAWLHFTRGEVAEGEETLSAALAGLDPDQATEVIQLLAALERLSPAGSEALARAVALGEQAGASAGQAALEAALETAVAGDRAPLRFQAARSAIAAGDSTAARRHLAALVDESPDAPEVPEALLLRARLLATRPEGVDAARELLTGLIVDRPDAAVVPDARRELERLGAPGGGHP